MIYPHHIKSAFPENDSSPVEPAKNRESIHHKPNSAPSSLMKIASQQTFFTNATPVARAAVVANPVHALTGVVAFSAVSAARARLTSSAGIFGIGARASAWISSKERLSLTDRNGPVNEEVLLNLLEYHRRLP